MAQQSTPFQSLYRTVVMVGTLAVGSMAAYQYGPPPEKLGDLIDQGMERIAEMQADENADAAAMSEPPPFATTASSPTNVPTPRYVDTQIQTASTFLSPATETTGEGAALLIKAGATEATVEPWGLQGNVYRAAASMPVGATGMTRQFDAIAETPEQATQDVLAQVRLAQVRLAQ